MTRRPPNPFGTPKELPPGDDNALGSEAPLDESAEPSAPESKHKPTEEHRPPKAFGDVDAGPGVAERPAEADSSGRPEAPAEFELPPTDTEAPSARPGEDSERREGPAWPEAPAHARETQRPGRAERGNIPVFDTLREAARIVIDNRGAVLMPLFVVTIPVALITSLVTALIFLTLWSDRSLASAATLTTETPTSTLFFLAVTASIELFFVQVARAGSIVAIDGVRRGQAPSVSECLDPAFSRLGGILALSGLWLMFLFVTVLPIIGWFLAPYLLLRSALVFESYLLEGGTTWTALSRSWALMQGNMLRLLGLVLLAAVCVLPAFAIMSFVSSAIGGSREAEIVLMAGWGVLQAVLIVPIVAFFTACTTLYYLKTKAIEDGGSTA